MDMSPESVQKLMLTPKMLLSSHVLQLALPDLRLCIQAELEDNPFLEAEEGEYEPSEEQRTLEEEISLLTDGPVSDQAQGPDTVSVHSVEDEQAKSYRESLVTKKESLYEHLHWQLCVNADTDEEKRIGEQLIGSLNAQGLLPMDLESMRQSIHAELGPFRKAVRLIRTFDPLGIGARTIQESLLLQLLYSGKAETSLYRIVYFHLEDLEKGRFEQIAGTLDLTVEQVIQAKKRLAYFNPWPANGFAGDEPSTVTEPDVFIMKQESGDYFPELNEAGLPRLKMSSYYRSILLDTKLPDSTKDYVRKKIEHAQWFLEAIHQRNVTIKRVCTHIFQVQRPFITDDSGQLQPLTFQRVADDLALSKSTVSRAVFNKQVQADDWLMPLKDFFSGYFRTTDGRQISEQTVQARIQACIKEEPAGVPLSDQKIAECLHTEGIVISRRTVAKYRQKLLIINSYRRRNYL